MERREQTAEIGSIGLYELIGSFDDVINKFKKEKEKFLSDERYKEYHKISIDVQNEDYEEIVILGTRYETDGEVFQRAMSEKKSKEYRRQQFIKLQEEFGEDNV
jgi:hypothetical protein